jgi:hypothetical protein
MFWALDFVHPISIIVFILALHGFILFIWRRKAMDKLFLVWFIVIYVFFTLIGTKSWRYILPLFPAMAIFAASFVSFLYDKTEKVWKSVHLTLDTKWMAKFCAACLIVITGVAVVNSAVDAYGWISKDAVSIPLQEAVHYIANRLSGNESVMVVCAVNVIDLDMIKFYLNAYESKNNLAWQYPILPADSYTPNFNLSEMVLMCQQKDVKYLLLYEYKDSQYFNSTLTSPRVYDMLVQSGKFTYQTIVGKEPYKIYIFQVNATALNT